MFILTGIIGVFQLFQGPKSVGVVTVAGVLSTRRSPFLSGRSRRRSCRLGSLPPTSRRAAQ